MTTDKNKQHRLNQNKGKGILLVLMPFWASLIPPLGLACLKSFLEPKGYHVKTADANLDERFKKGYQHYFAVLKEMVPREMRGNFYNVGNDLLRNHCMVYLNKETADTPRYNKLVQRIFARNFFCKAEPRCLDRLNRIVAEFYNHLEAFLTDLLDKEKPAVFGVSVFNGTLAPSLFAFKLAKQKYPGIVNVMGGGIFADDLALNSIHFDYFLQKTPYIDKIVVGEGELLFHEILSRDLHSPKKVYTLEDIHHKTLDISNAPLPDFSDLDLRYYPHMTHYTSRSCPFNCSFCSEKVIWGKYRKKSGQETVRQLNELYRKYGSRIFLIGDSLLNPIISELAAEMEKQDLPIYWDGYLRADKPVCDIANTMAWRKGGFYRARLGLESGSPKILSLMGKKITPRQIKDAVSSLAYAGIKTTAYWVIGHPGETEADFQKTLDVIEELKDDIYEADCNPFNFYYSGQVHSGEWRKENNCLPVYPESDKDLLILQTYYLDTTPSREEIYRRVIRFTRHCEKLGIPNPYSLYDIERADQRWKRMQKNAVPTLAELRNRDLTPKDCKNIHELISAKAPEKDDGNWEF